MAGFFEGGKNTVTTILPNTTELEARPVTEQTDGGLFDTGQGTAVGTVPSTGQSSQSSTAILGDDGGFFTGSIIPGTVEVQVGPRGPQGEPGGLSESIQNQINTNTSGLENKQDNLPDGTIIGQVLKWDGVAWVPSII